jgi:hypothetical protein
MDAHIDGSVRDQQCKAAVGGDGGGSCSTGTAAPLLCSSPAVGARGWRITRHRCTSAAPHKTSPACICTPSGSGDPLAAEAPMLGRESAAPQTYLRFRSSGTAALASPRSRMHKFEALEKEARGGNSVGLRASRRAAQQASKPLPSLQPATAAHNRYAHPPTPPLASLFLSLLVTPQLPPAAQRTREAARRPGSAARW